MAKVYVKIDIANMEEAKEKAVELIETLGKAKDLLTQLNEMEIIILDRLADPYQEQ